KEGDFIGKDALAAWEERGAENAFATIEVHGGTDADARGSEAIYKDGELVGRTTSGGYGWRTKKSLALGLVENKYAEIGTELEIEILGELYKTTVIEESPFDPGNECLRS
ncbi:MAG: aminomethyl transferase family protein, partial [Gammaproteobacteria bacterium]|nr:aminomethyl transferase family protein [Gammaproteobacteria bacterium]